MEGFYSVGEVVWLLALSRKDAIAEGLGDATRVPTLALWSEVRAARRRLGGQRRDTAAAWLLAQGHSQGEVAEQLGMSQQTVSRRFRASIEQLVDELNGTHRDGVRVVPAERPSQTVRLLTAAAGA